MKKWAVVGLALLFGAVLAGAPSPAAAELKVGVGGYVKLDIQHSDKIIGDAPGVPSPGPGSVPLDPPAGSATLDNSQTLMDARESRLRATFSDEVAGVKMSGRIETDFFGGGVLRLRHAYARADHPSGFSLLAGQTWSLFMNSDIAQPDLVDFNGPAGQLFSRQPQLRVGYKMPLARGMGDLLLEADIERHSTTNLGATGVGAPDESTGEGQMPLFAGKVSWLHPRFQAEAAFAVADSTVILAAGNDVSKTAWGLQVSAQANFDPFTVFGHYQMIDGLGRLANGDFPNAIAVGVTGFENIESTGFYLGATYNLTKDTSVTGMYGWAKADAVPGTTFSATSANQETQQSIHITLLHKFWQRWQAGLEFRRFDVEAFNGTSGDVNIVHGALWFFF